tara:strand:- start:3155 stop:3493 length:339 start_codon:yes stop_codon:yes gene_type:complete
MAQELGSNCLGDAATQSDYINFWIDGQFIDAVVCPFSNSFTGVGFAILLLAGILVYMAITNQSFVILALLGIIISGFVFQVVTFGPLIEAWYLIVLFSIVSAFYVFYRKMSG